MLLVIQRLVPQSIRNLGQASNTAFARTQRYTTKIVQFFTVQFCILLTWVFFRALNMDIAEIYFTGLFSNQTGIDLNLSLAAWFCFTLFAIDHAYGARAQTHEKIMKNPIIRVIFWLSLIMIAHHGMPEGENPFIYFQF